MTDHIWNFAEDDFADLPKQEALAFQKRAMSHMRAAVESYVTEGSIFLTDEKWQVEFWAADPLESISCSRDLAELLEDGIELLLTANGHVTSCADCQKLTELDKILVRVREQIASVVKRGVDKVKP